MDVDNKGTTPDEPRSSLFDFMIDMVRAQAAVAVETWPDEARHA